MADSQDNANGGGADFGAGGADASFGGDISTSGSGAGIGGGNGVSGASGNGIGTDNSGGSGLSNAGSFGTPGGPAVDLSSSTPGIDYGAVQEAMTNLSNGIAAIATLNPLGAIGIINAVTHVGPQVELAVVATLSSDPNVAAQQLAAFAQY
jgi:hypothetical protein